MRLRRRFIALVGVLLAAWWGAAWLTVGAYFERMADATYVAEQARVEEFVANTVRGFERQIAARRGAAAVLARDLSIRRVLVAASSDPTAAKLGDEEKARRWTADPALAAMNRRLDADARELAVTRLYLLNAAGDCIASSTAPGESGTVGTRYADREYFRQAQEGRPGLELTLGRGNGARALRYSAPVIENGRFVGAVVNRVDLDQMADRIGQADAFLADRNGVVLLARDKALEMHALAGAKVGGLDARARLAAYRQSEFPELAFASWGDARHPGMMQSSLREAPFLLRTRALPADGLSLTVMWPLPRIVELGQRRVRFSIAAGLVGTLLILLAAGLVTHLRSLHEARHALAKRESEFRSLAENSPDVIVRYDGDCRRTYVSPAHERATGQPAADMLGKSPLECWSVPTGREGAAAFQAHLRRVLATGRPAEWELAWRKADGSAVRMEVRCVPEFDAAGKVAGMLTLARDVSARRAMEDRLRMAASVFETAGEGITITDPAGIILDVNPAFERITGYGREDVLGKNPRLLSSGRHDPAFYAAMWRALADAGAWSGEVVNRRKNGEIYNEILSISAVRDDRGATLHYVAVFTDITLLKQQEQRMRHIAHHDVLTGLPNRILLTDRMRQAIAQAHRAGEVLAVAFLDLDGFKPINDKYGHEVGDRILIEIAQRLTQGLRASDTVARVGGDEFVMLLAGQASAKECEFTARRLLDAIAQSIAVDGIDLTLSASIGIGIYPDDGDDPDGLMRNADQAMYAAKRLGRNQFVFYGQDVREKTKSQGHLVHDLRLALEHGEIAVHYQPIVDLVSGRVLKAEALARWTHPERGPVSPAEFIPVAEDAGLIHALGDRVFRDAVRVALAWNRICPPRHGNEALHRIGVNRSPRQFFTHNGVDDWVGHLSELRVSGDMLSVEITEGLLLDDRPDVLRQLNQMRAMGITLSLDDFGTGYSALSYLKKFNIDYLKIDRSFVRDIDRDESDRAIVESIIAMARRLGIRLIAEGVETQAQADLLAAAGCHLAQGYLYARPMPEDEFLAFVSAAEAAPLAAPGGRNNVEMV